MKVQIILQAGKRNADRFEVRQSIHQMPQRSAQAVQGMHQLSV